MRDFTNYLNNRTYRVYSGTNGKKLGIKINDECYFLSQHTINSCQN
ncbi:MAG: hypothetical protein MR902_05810 [Campylobacter sp.]|nr:hypothetical protein [Campylobacter sp.]